MFCRNQQQLPGKNLLQEFTRPVHVNAIHFPTLFIFDCNNLFQHPPEEIEIDQSPMVWNKDSPLDLADEENMQPKPWPHESILHPNFLLSFTSLPFSDFSGQSDKCFFKCWKLTPDLACLQLLQFHMNTFLTCLDPIQKFIEGVLQKDWCKNGKAQNNLRLQTSFRDHFSFFRRKEISDRKCVPIPPRVSKCDQACWCVVVAKTSVVYGLPTTSELHTTAKFTKVWANPEGLTRGSCF